MMKNFVSSYKDLPAYPYQFQTKFRNELRAKSGLMRGKEFLMKDLYSLSRNQQQHDEFYELATQAYHKVFQRFGIGDITYKTFASGGIFAKYSHEFQTISDVGEDTIYVHKAKNIAINKEVYNDEVLADLGVSKDELEELRAVEVGNIFSLGTKFSEPLELVFTDDDGAQKPVIMGSYGIGPSRMVGLLAEHFADDKGLVWPVNIAPYKVYLATIGEVETQANELYEKLQNEGIEVLYDDRDERPGNKFADADLMGIPVRLVLSERTLENNNVELKLRSNEEAELVSLNDCIIRIKEIITQ
jgi:prolyl-tRNA synthetase